MCCKSISFPLSFPKVFTCVCVCVLTICLTDARNGATFQIHDQTTCFCPSNWFPRHKNKLLFRLTCNFPTLLETVGEVLLLQRARRSRGETLRLLLHLLFHLCNVHACVLMLGQREWLVGWRWRCPAVRVFYNQKP